MHRRPATALTLLLASLLAAGCDALDEGVDAYGAGRYDDAYAAFTRAEQEAGGDASAELLFDKALAGLRVGELTAAETAAKGAAARGGPEFTALGDFVLGNVAFARCRTAGVQARGPEAEPFAFDVAIAYGETARDAWAAAATSRPDWPEARRNVERALLEIEDLRRRKAAAEQRKARKEPDAPGPPKPLPTPRPKPVPTAGDPEMEPDDGARPVEFELTPEQVRKLLETLAAKEKEKRDLRRDRRRVRSAEVEKDW